MVRAEKARQLLSYAYSTLSCIDIQPSLFILNAFPPMGQLVSPSEHTVLPEVR